LVEVTPYRNIEEALEAIRQFDGPAGRFRLSLADSILDPSGANLAIVTDAILVKGWLPDGFEDRGDYRLFRYKEME
jgi:hypothetical protein